MCLPLPIVVVVMPYIRSQDILRLMFVTRREGHQVHFLRHDLGTRFTATLIDCHVQCDQIKTANALADRDGDWERIWPVLS
jgi:hypothetical protein